MSEQKYTVFADDGVNFVVSGTFGTPDDLDGAISDLSRYGCTPFAWAPEASASAGGTKSSFDLRDESIAAGRTIEKVDGRYVARGVPEEKKETPFRVGGRYRIGKGDTRVELIRERAHGHMPPEGYAAMRMGDGFILYQFARLSDGRAVHACDLEPVGEDCGLDLNDGQWVAADEEKADSIPGKKLLETLDNAEPERAPLTWNQPAKTDRFPGFTTTKSEVPQPQRIGFTSPDLEEVSPLCGSAWLVLGE